MAYHSRLIHVNMFEQSINVLVVGITVLLDVCRAAILR